MIIFLIFLISFLMLYYGGELLVRSSISIALKMRISSLVVGMTIVSFATSAPELFVSVQSSLKGVTDITFGNVIGSNISNITLVLGLTAIVFKINISRETYLINYPIMFLISLLLGLSLYLGDGLNRLNGSFFVLLLCFFSWFLILRSRKNNESIDLDYNEHEGMTLSRSILYMIIAILLLAFGSDFLVDGIGRLSERFSISERVISLSLVAIGTSVPELATSLVAAFRRAPNLAIGNLIGSNIFNVLAVLGITSIITPINLSYDKSVNLSNGSLFLDHPLFLDYIWMIGSSMVLGFFIYIFSKSVLNRIEGIFLFATYILFLVALL